MHAGGPFLQHTRILCAALAAATIVLSKPALAEFQIQEASIEKGETELEYRGAYHWGVPEATDSNPNANDLVQSHEFELQYSPTNWWLLQLTLGTEQPLHEEFEASDVEFETEFALIKRKGDGIALSFQGGYEKSTIGEAESAVGAVKWVAILFQALCVLVAIAMVHSDNRRACAITLTLFTTGVALSVLLIAAYSRPFTGEISVAPELLKQVIATEAKEDNSR